MTSIALSTMRLTATVTDEDTGNAVYGATVQLLGIIDENGDAVATGDSFPIELADEGDGTYTWLYSDNFRTALGTRGSYHAQIQAEFNSAVRYSEPIINVRTDRT